MFIVETCWEVCLHGMGEHGEQSTIFFGGIGGQCMQRDVVDNINLPTSTSKQAERSELWTM